jgi:tetratricopeptide (TPR) repeat protein/GGDEF domain-containing protein
MLFLDDLNILRFPFAQEVQQLLPLPATIDFCFFAADGVLRTLPMNLTGESSAAGGEIAFFTEPCLMNDQLVIPLQVVSGESVAAVVSDVDPALLKRMSASWLRELQASIVDQLEKTRWGFIDPETELYNRRAATVLLQQSAPENPGFFFLLNAVFYRRTAAGNLQKTRETAALLQALTQGSCFSFGCGVFGLLLQGQRREQALKTAHHLRRQLKREGMSKVQIGFSQAIPSDTRLEATVLDRFWRSLAIAEKRGPFGICDTDAINEQRPHLFQLTQTDLLGTLQRRWRSLAQFTLAVFSLQPQVQYSVACADRIKRLVPQGGMYLDGGSGLALILFPEPAQISIRECIDSIRSEYQECYGEGAVSVGIAAWPCLDFVKNDIPGNCLKALLHGSFLGPGSVVLCDHLSLNISGDFFFEEGDYRTAIREYRRGLLLQPRDVNLINSLGVVLIECNQKRQAADCFQDVLQIDPDNYMALVNLGHVQQTLGHKDIALDCFERAYRVHANEDTVGQELFLPLGRLYAELCNHEKAVTVLEHWRTRPGSEKEFILFRLLGQSYMENGTPVEAIKACQRALQLFPQDSISLSTLGLLYVEQGEGSEVGLSLCRKALTLDNFNPDHWCRLGRAMLHIGRQEEALDAIRQCLRLRRNHREAVLLLGTIYQAMGRDNQASRCFRQAMAIKGCVEKQVVQGQKHLV